MLLSVMVISVTSSFVFRTAPEASRYSVLEEVSDSFFSHCAWTTDCDAIQKVNAKNTGIICFMFFDLFY